MVRKLHTFLSFHDTPQPNRRDTNPHTAEPWIKTAATGANIAPSTDSMGLLPVFCFLLNLFAQGMKPTTAVNQINFRLGISRN